MFGNLKFILLCFYARLKCQVNCTFSSRVTGVYSEPCQASKMERFAKKAVTIFAKWSTLDLWQSPVAESPIQFLLPCRTHWGIYACRYSEFTQKHSSDRRLYELLEDSNTSTLKSKYFPKQLPSSLFKKMLLISKVFCMHFTMKIWLLCLSVVIETGVQRCSVKRVFLKI